MAAERSPDYQVGPRRHLFCTDGGDGFRSQARTHDQPRLSLSSAPDSVSRSSCSRGGGHEHDAYGQIFVERSVSFP